jgi:class 3 adenylate cyclase
LHVFPNPNPNPDPCVALAAPLQLDAVARRYSVFKVETIGDAYMAVANLVQPQPDHTRLIALFAQEAVAVANRTMVQEDSPELGYVNIRVGFHSGESFSDAKFCESQR